MNFCNVYIFIQALGAMLGLYLALTGSETFIKIIGAFCFCGQVFLYLYGGHR